MKELILVERYDDLVLMVILYDKDIVILIHFNEPSSVHICNSRFLS